MPSLYELGWRQGSVLRTELHATVVVAEGDGIALRHEPHPLWIVATQDCDLFASEPNSPEPTIELRPVYESKGSMPSGIRARRLRLSRDRQQLLYAESPRCMVSPAALMAVIERMGGERVEWLGDGERLALKMWLGLRYDRPAVPQHLVSLARALGKSVENRKTTAVIAEIRDVLAQFGDSTPPTYRLYAVVTPEASVDDVRTLLIDAGLDVDPGLGTLDAVEVGTAAEISIDVLETSFPVDLSQITWGTGLPEGAT